MQCYSAASGRELGHSLDTAWTQRQFTSNHVKGIAARTQEGKAYLIRFYCSYLISIQCV